MQAQITTRGMPSSPALEAEIQKRVDKLISYFDNIIKCSIVFELIQKHKHQGKLYNVRINVSVPGKELAATYKYDEDIYVAIRDAFHALTKQLEEHAEKRHGQVKLHDETLHGSIARLFNKEGYGFIQGNDGNEYYFSITNVNNPHFSELLIGDEVEFIPKTFDDGHHAHHVVKA